MTTSRTTPLMAAPSVRKQRLAGSLSRRRWVLPLVLMTWIANSIGALAQGPLDESAPRRELLVPFADLNILLRGDHDRVLLPRAEYEDLLARARAAQELRAPQVQQGAVSLEATYRVSLSPGRADIEGELSFEVFSRGLQAIPLDLARVGVMSATWDGQPAAIGQGADGAWTLFVREPGRHELKLTMVAATEMSSVDQILNVRLPKAAVTKWRLTAPGDVELKSGAGLLARTVNEAGKRTSFELTPSVGDVPLVFSLNSHLAAADRLVFSRGVLIDEITSAYERLHATITLEVPRQAITKAEWRLPEGFRVESVAGPLVAKWRTSEQADEPILGVEFREPFAGQSTVQITAVLATSRTTNWEFPRLVPVDVSGQSAVVGVLLEDRLRTRASDESGLAPIDARLLVEGAPVEVLAAGPGVPRVRPVAAFYAPAENYAWKGSFDEIPAKLLASTNWLLNPSDARLEIHGVVNLEANAEAVSAVTLLEPEGWRIDSVTTPEGAAAPYETFEHEGTRRVVIQTPGGIPSGQTRTLHVRASRAAPGWLDDWAKVAVAFPEFRIEEAANEVGALAVSERDDLLISPTEASDLYPLDDAEKARNGLGDVATSLAYRYEAHPYSLALDLERRAPRVVARTTTFVSVEADSLSTRAEIAYEIDTAPTKRLSFLLPENTPADLTIMGLDGLAIKEFAQSTADGVRRWTVQLAEERRGTARLAIEFQRTLPPESRGEVTLAVPRAAEVAYQSGLVAVEADDDLDVVVARHPRPVDVGELAAANYQPGPRLLGVYSYLDDSPEIVVNLSPRDLIAMRPTLIESAELTTRVSAEGLSETFAKYRLRTKEVTLQVELPREAVLWSVSIDDEPIKPRSYRDRLSVGVPASPRGGAKELKISFESPLAPLSLGSELEFVPPRFFVVDEIERDAASATDAESPVPVSNSIWEVHLPSGYRLLAGDDAFVAESSPRPDSALVTSARWLAGILGGVDFLHRDRLGDFGPFEAKKDDFKSDAKADKAKSPEVKSAKEGADSAAAGAMSGMGGVDKMRDMLPNAAKDEKKDADAGDDQAPVDSDAAADDAESDSSPADRMDKSRESEAQVKGSAAESGRGDGKARLPSRWSLAGARSLRIDYVGNETPYRFRDLGESDALRVTVSRSTVSKVGWCVALAVLLWGLADWRKPFGRRLRFAIVVGTLATLVAAVVDWPDLIEAANLVFYAALILVVCAFVCAGWHGLVARIRPNVTQGSVAAAIAIAIASISGAAFGQETPSSGQDAESPPVTIPPDAIVIPYDPDAPAAAAESLLVPREEFDRLTKWANPEAIPDAPSPAPFAWTGAQYEAVLGDDEAFLARAEIGIEVYSADAVTIPLALEGGVLTQATLDGEQAKLRLARPEDGAAEGLLVLETQGVGPRKLNLSIRFTTQTQGGWRIVSGRIPSSPVTKISLSAPKAGTEIKFESAIGRFSRETQKDGESFTSSLGGDGRARFEWRPKLAVTQVDRRLSARSSALFDIQEEGLALAWKIDLEFPRESRDTFELKTPAGWRVEKLEGANVRGWEAKTDEGGGVATISLLRPAIDAESFLIRLSRPGALTMDGASKFPAPFVEASGASLHVGVLAIRRGRWLDVRASASSNAARSDTPLDEATRVALEPTATSPLGLAPFESYRFTATPFVIPLEATSRKPRWTAQAQVLTRIGERERQLEARALVEVSERPLHLVTFEIPSDWNLERVSAPEPFEWNVVEGADRKLALVRLLDGRMGSTPIVLAGKWGPTGALDSITLPKIVVQGAQSQSTEFAVQVDPAFDVETRNLIGCETILTGAVEPWLGMAQREHTRLAIRAETPDYSGTVKWTPRESVIECVTLSNARITKRSIEETILFDFDVRQAGTRELTILLPASLRDARMQVPLLRSKTIEPVAGNDSLVRVRLSLRDDLMGQVRVLVENDRPLTLTPQTAPIPVVEGVGVSRRFVSLEGAGRDEVTVESTTGLAPLARGQSEWKTVSAMLGGEAGQVWRVSSSAAEAELRYEIQNREVVRAQGARIGLAETTLAVDPRGAYRGSQVYHVDNTTEPFLELETPKDAEIWTAMVAGKPVKLAAAGVANRARVPLIKTSPGDLDYEVIVKYGGKLPTPAPLARVEFPFLKSVNLRVEVSQVRLYLPETNHWWSFDGLGEPVSDSDQRADEVDYITGQFRRLRNFMESVSPMSVSRDRAKKNLSDLEARMSRSRKAAPITEDSGRYRQAWTAQGDAISEFKREEAQRLESAQRQEASAPDGESSAGNRGRLGAFYEGQQGKRSKNQVQRLENNFEANQQAEQPAQESFDRGWLERNKLPADGQQPGGALAPPTDSDERERSSQTRLPRAQPPANGKSQTGLQVPTQTAMPAMNDNEFPPDSAPGRDMPTPLEPTAKPASPKSNEDSIVLFDSSGGMDAGGSAQSPKSKPTGLASLDIDLPTPGRLYRFTTSRGELALSARVAPRRWLEIALRVGIVTLALVCLVLIARWLRGVSGRRLSQIAIVAGLLCFGAGILPWGGALLSIAGLVGLAICNPSAPRSA